jgi:hypothetical protein
VERKGKIIVSFRSCPAETSIKQEGRERTLNQRLFLTWSTEVSKGGHGV